MKKLVSILSWVAVSSMVLAANSFAAPAAQVRCTAYASDMGPDSFFYIASDAVGATVTVGGEDYRVVGSQPEFHDDIYMQMITLQSVKNPDGVQPVIVCF